MDSTLVTVLLISLWLGLVALLVLDRLFEKGK
jgi:hypothetical protein